MNDNDSSNTEMVLYSYSIGFIYILIIEVFSGQIFDAISFCSKVSIRSIKQSIELNEIIIFKYPTETYGYITIFSTVGYLGVNVVLTLVRHFGALIAVTGS